VGLKNIKHEVVFMANDEGITTKLVGKKVAPVLQMVADDVIMPEVRVGAEREKKRESLVREVSLIG
jgi:glutaredoxin 2